MKKVSICMLLGLFALGFRSSAQTGETVIAEVAYQFIHVNDLNNPDKPWTEDMILQLGKTETNYRRAFAKQQIKAAPASNAVVAAPATRTVAGGPMAVVNATGITAVEWYQHVTEGKLNMTASFAMNNYLVEHQLPKIAWKISEETRKIGDYTCQKAVGEFAGRTYTAWFAPDLPFQNGPWKLSGLPGLILEATDAKNEVKFLFKDITRTPEVTSTNQYPRKYITASIKDFERAKNAYDENPVAAFQSQLPPDGPKVKVAFRDPSGKYTIGDDAEALIEKNKRDGAKIKANPVEIK